jgi:hypothetical protein
VSESVVVKSSTLYGRTWYQRAEETQKLWQIKFKKEHLIDLEKDLHKTDFLAGTVLNSINI